MPPSMTSRGTGVVGYNVQSAVDAKHHLIVAHDVSKVGSDRRQLSTMAKHAKEVLAYNMKRAINLVGTRKIMEMIDP